MKCPNCDRINENNAKFCKTCGINLQEKNIEENKETNNINIPTIENNAKHSEQSCCLGCSACIIVISIIIIIIASF